MSAAARPRLLVVEDEESLAKVLKMRLEMEGYEVRTAGDGEEALQKVGEERPDLIVSDLMMPVMDGVELTRVLKADPDLSSIPILILTALKSEKERAELNQLGVDGIASKPYDSKTLTTQIRALLG